MKYTDAHLTMSVYSFGGYFLYEEKPYDSLEAATEQALRTNEIDSIYAFISAKTALDSSYDTKPVEEKRKDYTAFRAKKLELQIEIDSLRKTAVSGALKTFNVLASVKIAKGIIEKFKPETEVAEAINYFKNPREVKEALVVANSQLRDRYIDSLKNWFLKQHDINETIFQEEINNKTDFSSLLSKCMEHGLNAIAKNDPFNEIFSEDSLLSGSSNSEKTDHAEPNKIEKKRKWADILKDQG